MDRRKELLSKLFAVAVVTSIYILAGKIGLALAVLNPMASSVWLPAGIAIGAFVVFGYRLWPAIFLAAFFVAFTLTSSAATALGIAVGNTLEGLAGAYLINLHADGRRVFDRVSNTIKFGILASIPPTISATCAVTVMGLNGIVAGEYYNDTWWAWWLGNVTGILIAAPVMILWANRDVRYDRRQLLDDSILAAVLFGSALFMSGILFPPRIQHYPLAFFSFPIVVGCALKFGARAASAATLVLTAVAVWRTVSGIGQFAVAYPPQDAMVLRQIFACLVSMNGLVVGAVVAERRRSKDLKQWLATIVEHSNEAIIGKDLNGIVLSWNHAAERLFGHTAQEIIGRSASVLSPLHRFDELPQLLEQVRRGELIDRYETQRLRKDRTCIDVLLTISPIKDATGKIVGASSIAREVFRWPNRETQETH